jgi:peptidoglycan/LPS O-acetylase OafA/YrhL
MAITVPTTPVIATINSSVAGNLDPISPPLPSFNLPFLDNIRGLSMMAVYGVHLADFAYDLDTTAWVGLWRNFNVPALMQWLYPLYGLHIAVGVFFLISGLCIQLSWEKTQHHGWGVFFNRRFFRIYPPYLFALALFAFLPVLAPPQFNGAEWASHVVMLHNLRPEWLWGVNSSFWSLALEWQLYCVFPLLVWATHRWSWGKVLGLLGIIEVTLRLWRGLADAGLTTLHPPFVVGYSPLGFWFSWALGAWLGQKIMRQQKVLTHPLWLWGSLVAMVGALCCRVTEPLAFLLGAVFTAAVVAKKVFTARKTVKTASGKGVITGLSRYTAFIGQLSFSAYLLHQPLLLKGLPWLMGQWHVANTLENRLLAGVMLWPVVVLLAWAMYHGIEKPSITLGKRVLTQVKSRQTKTAVCA